jgi:Spy/CpxP family protein refolding chaperone
MLSRILLALAFTAVVPLAVAAESPYATLEQREIKALSADEITALRTGQGFSQALSAELNGFPGPRHVIELADRLGLDAAQRSAVETLFASMQAEAVAAGEAVLDAEADFERAFRADTITESEVAAATEEIGRLRGILRGIHLRYHLRTKTLLTPHQVALYNAARGYSAGGHGAHGSHTAQ